MKIGAILDQIDEGAMALPEFQRGYVWNRDQVRGLMDSLYRRHPVGSLLTWVTKTENVNQRGDTPLPPGTVKLLLDGQQRVTTLYGIIRGAAPAFFEGNEKTFTGLYFNVRNENFEFYAPIRMGNDPLWVNVGQLMQEGVWKTMEPIQNNPDLSAEEKNDFGSRLNAVDQIKDIDLHIEEVTGTDKDIDTVVDIFNRVNSGGTKLSKGDLALAKICAEWPEARSEMKELLDTWGRRGFKFKLEWLLRCVNTVVTGEALFAALSNKSPEDIRIGLSETATHINYALNLLSSRLGIDNSSVLLAPYSIALIVRYLSRVGGAVNDPKERDKLLYWYIHVTLWGRYSGSTETFLNQDLEAIEEVDGGLDRLIANLRTSRGDLQIHPEDFKVWSKGSRFYPLLYMMTRVHKAQDWETGQELSHHLLGNNNRLEVHHIFPKSKLNNSEFDYKKPEVNEMGNFTFLTQQTNLKVTNRDPEEYLKAFADNNPGSIESHWIPMDPNLWKIENYREFLAARRKLLATSANEFLNSLLEGSMPQVGSNVEPIDQLTTFDDEVTNEEEQILLNENIWIIENNLPEGELLYELVDEDNEFVAILDLAWPDGLQPGLSDPVALLIDESSEVEEKASHAGYLFFTETESFRKYVETKILMTNQIGLQN